MAVPVVTYCWGPGCDGATRAALALARLGYQVVKEMLGGAEYWIRKGSGSTPATARAAPTRPPHGTRWLAHLRLLTVAIAIPAPVGQLLLPGQ